ncbi:unnamed protein product [marine sediment metagenome]|uniref:Uncharacterized protein n=1 Tax=marine sediment metagenome TaxID=412755 RepID=X1EI85_9ZZZZ
MVAKVEWHQGDLFQRVGFIVTNLSARADNVVTFYNGRGIAEQLISSKYANNSLYYNEQRIGNEL